MVPSQGKTNANSESKWGTNIVTRNIHQQFGRDQPRNQHLASKINWFETTAKVRLFYTDIHEDTHQSYHGL